MIRLALAAALLFCSATVQAGPVQMGKATSTIGGAVVPHHIWTPCFIGDTQNIFSQDDEITPGGTVAGLADCKGVQNSVVPNTCSGPYCAKSPYCIGSWAQTATFKTTALANHLAGNDDLVDWGPIAAADPVPGRGSHLDHTCDVVISVGDMLDISDAVVALNLPISQLNIQDGGIEQYNRLGPYWTTILAHVPGLPTRGNHDPNDAYVTLMETTLNYTSKSYYFSRETARHLSYAALFPTTLGRPVCVVSVNASSAAGTSSQDANDLTWAAGAVGCGSHYPTILVEHGAYQPTSGSDTSLDVYTGAFPPWVRTILDAHNEVFMVVGGHWTNTLASHKKAFTAGGGNSVFGMFCNWQEGNTHPTGPSSLPYGNTPSDSGGLFYCVARIDADSKLLTSWDYSPYWGARHTPDDPTNHLAITTEFSMTLDFNAIP